ncbi:MAG: treY, partial [Planctomycetaceae bacterium]|nr:treY [Planctomycetaceae bacterium]
IDETRLPLDPRTYGTILNPVLESYRTEAGPEATGVLELQSIASAVRHLPSRDDPDASHKEEGLAEGLVIKRRLRELVSAEPGVVGHIDQVVQELGGSLHDVANFKALVELLEAQAYRPCFWRVALDEINYRRFFDVNDLAALSAEREDVFQVTHAKPLEWLQRQFADGLRIDHVDGLLDPEQYLARLQRAHLLGCAKNLLEANPDRYPGVVWSESVPAIEAMLSESHPPTQPAYVVVEKILGPRESLPASWACDGTTGYEFLNEVNGLFVDPDKVSEMTAVYQRFTGLTDTFDQLAYEKKLQILRSLLASELHVLAHRLDRLAQASWWSRDFTLNGLRHALEEIIACFPVYRSYVAQEAGGTDRVTVLRAARRARAMSPLLGREVFNFICDTLLLKDPPDGPASDEYRAAQRQFAGKFQQLTAPVMAKGVEDTALYIFNRLVSLNEVGGDPSHFGRSPAALHTFLLTRAQKSPGSLSPLSTHDTKRGEDVRARLNVLSEMTDEWGHRLERWRRLNSKHKVEIEEGLIALDANEEYLLYQTLIGTLLLDADAHCPDETYIQRIQAYMTKAVREAKVHSSWINPADDYDAGVSKFIASILNADLAPEFIADWRNFTSRIHALGLINSLSQTLIRCTAPGIPDTYQGTEVWDYSLVDPDNRRPVDYKARIAGLEKLERINSQSAADRIKTLSSDLGSGRAKMFVTAQALRLRRDRPDLFLNNNYAPLEATGPHANHLFAYLRACPTGAAIVAVPRLIASLNDSAEHAAELKVSLDAVVSVPPDWADNQWKNLLTGEEVICDSGRLSATQLFQHFPVALLVTD